MAPLTMQEIMEIRNRQGNQCRTAYNSRFFSHGVESECANVEEALKKYKLDWKVKTVPIRSHLPGTKFHDIDFFDHNGIIREDNNFPLATVGSSIYTPIQNEECLGMFNDIISRKEILIESGGIFDYGRRIWVATRLPQEVKIKFGEKEEKILRYLHISWSHDGSEAVNVSFMPYISERKISLTGFVPTGVPCSIGFKHTTNAKQRMQKGGEVLARAFIFFRDSEGMLRKMASENMSRSDFDEILKFIYPDKDDSPEDKESRSEKIRGKIFDRWQKIPSEIQKTKYGALIAISEYTDYEGRIAVRGSKEMSDSQKISAQNERRLDSSLFGSAQRTKTKAANTIFNFENLKKTGGLK